MSDDSHAGVRFHLEISGVDVRWQVLHAAVSESLGAPFSASVDARMEHGFVEQQELLGRPFALCIERGSSERRVLRGIVRQCRVETLADGHGCHLVLVPSLWLLGLGTDSRIFQDKTIPEVVAEVVEGALGQGCAVVSDDLTATYEAHEYLVQYQESTLAFVTRLLEQEGIFFALDCESDDRENLVLLDSSSGLPLAREHADGRVSYRDEHGMQGDFEEEHAFELRHREEVAPAAITLGHYDWSNPALALRESRRGESRVDPPLEVYDHTDAVTLHRYADPQYSHNTAERASLLRHELITQSAHHWTLNARVVTARPGTVIRLEGSAHDGSYLIVSAQSTGEARDDAEGRWGNRLVLQPVSMPYRPRLETPRPVIPGPVTAVVVGPAGEEIHTDSHGRVRVHFHWDRLAQPDAERSSCWIRVSQGWAGAGFGTFFLPRVGMEVVVSFLGGNPDRPLVTGCVYNGLNAIAADLPADKTQSYIRTRSSTQSEGYNELRFEDRAGSEEVHLHAQRNLREVVRHDHRTRVGNDQDLDVEVDQSTRVGGTQALHVEGAQREIRVDHEERHHVEENRTLTVGGLHEVTVRGEQLVEVDQSERHTVHQNRELVVDGVLQETASGGRTQTVTGAGLDLTVTGGVSQVVTSGGWDRIIESGGLHTTTTGGVAHTSLGDTAHTSTGSFTLSGNEVFLRSNSAVYVDAPAGIKVLGGGKSIEARDLWDHSAQQLSEIIHAMKLSVVALSISETGIKIAQAGVSYGSTEWKLERTIFKSSLAETASIDHSTLKIIN